MSILEYVINRLILERRYDILSAIFVEDADKTVETLKKIHPYEKEESLKEYAITLKRRVLDLIDNPLLNYCPYCYSSFKNAVTVFSVGFGILIS